MSKKVLIISSLPEPLGNRHFFPILVLRNDLQGLSPPN